MKNQTLLGRLPLISILVSACAVLVAVLLMQTWTDNMSVVPDQLPGVEVQGRLSVTMHDQTTDGHKIFHAYELKWGENYYAVLVVDGGMGGGMGMTVLK